jgi:hypothetical protein
VKKTRQNKKSGASILIQSEPKHQACRMAASSRRIAIAGPDKPAAGEILRKHDIPEPP